MTGIAPPIVFPPVVPPATIGILGTGPTTRYFEHAAQETGYRTLVLDPNVAKKVLLKAASECDVITIEIEQIAPAALHAAQRHAPVRPSAAIRGVVQDRARQKDWLASQGIPIGAYAVVGSNLKLTPSACVRFHESAASLRRSATTVVFVSVRGAADISASMRNLAGCAARLFVTRHECVHGSVWVTV